MNQAIQIELIERILAHLQARTTDMIDEPGAQSVDAYTSPDRLALEMTRLLRARPLNVAHISQLCRPGDFVTHSASGVPVLATRDRDGRLRAFLNVCRHRGTRVESSPCGNKPRFVCPYHAWTYGCDGRLLGIPHAIGFPRTPGGLVELSCAEQAGFVWVSLLPGAAVPPHVLPPAIADDLSSFGLDQHHVYDPRVFRKRLNWKLAIDIFLESYHLRSAHKDSIYPLFFDNVGLVDAFGCHLRTVFPKRTIRDLSGTDPADWRVRAHANVLYLLFPNTLVLMEPDHAGVLTIHPDGVDACEIHTYTLVPEPVTSDKARRYWDANNDILYSATDEDYAMGESIQSGLASGANEQLTFGRFEHALTYFHASVDREIRGEDLGD